MNKYLLLFIPLLLVGMTGSYLYTHHRLWEIRRLLPYSRVAVPPSAMASCGCTVDTDEHFPTTPQEIKQAKINAQREEAEGELRDEQTDNRVRRLIRVGMARAQVEQIMGDSLGGGETPPEPFKGHNAVDSDDYGDYEIAFSAKDTVAWVRPL